MDFTHESARSFLARKTASRNIWDPKLPRSKSPYRPRNELVNVLYTEVGQQVARFTMRGDRTFFLFTFADEDAVGPGDLASQKRCCGSALEKADGNVRRFWMLLMPRTISISIASAKYAWTTEKAYGRANA
jgi:hypothetical protein